MRKSEVVLVGLLGRTAKVSPRAHHAVPEGVDNSYVFGMHGALKQGD